MLNDTGLRMMELAGKGYCCSQIIIFLALDELGRENPDFIRGAAGLCNGLGDCSGPCGVYTGAALLLGLYAGKGLDIEEPADALPLMLESLRDWFAEATLQHGGSTCSGILSGNCEHPDPAVCGGLINDAYAKVRDVLVENGFNPAEGRTLS